MYKFDFGMKNTLNSRWVIGFKTVSVELFLLRKHILLPDIGLFCYGRMLQNEKR